jgi:dihydroflavonol-4-reductase
MVLVTGSTGLVGSYLLYYLLENGKQIRAMKRKSSSVVAVKNVFQELNPEKSRNLF